jgi:hypothetical protein
VLVLTEFSILEYAHAQMKRMALHRAALMAYASKMAVGSKVNARQFGSRETDPAGPRPSSHPPAGSGSSHGALARAESKGDPSSVRRSGHRAIDIRSCRLRKAAAPGRHWIPDAALVTRSTMFGQQRAKAE